MGEQDPPRTPFYRVWVDNRTRVKWKGLFRFIAADSEGTWRQPWPDELAGAYITDCLESASAAMGWGALSWSVRVTGISQRLLSMEASTELGAQLLSDSSLYWLVYLTVQELLQSPKSP